MKQPELGQKIAELRLSKGLTQTELATRCNVSLRTIQRIEQAEVMPRSFTVRLIFSQLGQEFYDQEIPSDEVVRNNGVLDFLKDLFNLKTHTMKKITILSLPVLLTVFLFAGWSTMAQNDKKAIQEITESSARLTKLFNSGQIQDIGNLYAQHAHYMAPQVGEIPGHENIVRFYQSLYDSGFRLEESEPIEIVIDNNLAVERGLWSSVTPGISKGNYMTQWKKVNGKWLITNDITNVVSSSNP